MNLPTFFALGPLGTPEMIIIAVLVLVLFGAKKIPTFARSIGKSMGEFKRARDEFENELKSAAEEPVKPNLPTSPSATAQSSTEQQYDAKA